MKKEGGGEAEEGKGERNGRKENRKVSLYLYNVILILLNNIFLYDCYIRKYIFNKCFEANILK